MFNIRGKKTLNGRIGIGKAGAPLAFCAFFLVLGLYRLLFGQN